MQWPLSDAITLFETSMPLQKSILVANLLLNFKTTSLFGINVWSTSNFSNKQNRPLDPYILTMTQITPLDQCLSNIGLQFQVFVFVFTVARSKRMKHELNQFWSYHQLNAVFISENQTTCSDTDTISNAGHLHCWDEVHQWPQVIALCMQCFYSTEIMSYKKGCQLLIKTLWSVVIIFHNHLKMHITHTLQIPDMLQIPTMTNPFPHKHHIWKCQDGRPNLHHIPPGGWISLRE